MRVVVERVRLHWNIISTFDWRSIVAWNCVFQCVYILYFFNFVFEDFQILWAYWGVDAADWRERRLFVFGAEGVERGFWGVFGQWWIVVLIGRLLSHVRGQHTSCSSISWFFISSHTLPHVSLHPLSSLLLSLLFTKRWIKFFHWHRPSNIQILRIFLNWLVLLAPIIGGNWHSVSSYWWTTTFSWALSWFLFKPLIFVNLTWLLNLWHVNCSHVFQAASLFRVWRAILDINLSESPHNLLIKSKGTVLPLLRTLLLRLFTGIELMTLPLLLFLARRSHLSLQVVIAFLIHHLFNDFLHLLLFEEREFLLFGPLYSIFATAVFKLFSGWFVSVSVGDSLLARIAGVKDWLLGWLVATLLLLVVDLGNTWVFFLVIITID